MSAFGGMLAGGGTVLVSILGILTAWQQGWALTSTGWLLAAYVSVFVAIVVPPLTLKKYGDKAKALMSEAYQKGEVLAEQRRLVSGPQARAAELFCGACWPLLSS